MPKPEPLQPWHDYEFDGSEDVPALIDTTDNTRIVYDSVGDLLEATALLKTRYFN